MDGGILRAELANDPVGLGYAGQSDDAIADLLNSRSTGRTRLRDTVPTRDILHAIAAADYGSLSAADRTRLQTILAAGSVDPENANIRAHFAAMFPNGAGPTRQALAAISRETVSRAEELGLGVVYPVEVMKARAG